MEHLDAFPKKTGDANQPRVFDHFDAFPSVTRGVQPAIFRGSAPVYHDPKFGPSSALIHKEDTFTSIDTTEERPPALPYTWEVCPPNTFTCADSAMSPRELQEKLKELIRMSPADISSNSEWEFSAVFYPQETKTELKVCIYDNDTSPKKSCLVEMRRTQGDRVAFQGLVSYVQAKAKLVYAFAKEWGFENKPADESQFAGGYQHRSFAPLPIPASLLAKLDTIEIATDDFPFADSKFSYADALLENACSRYVDVRRNGWRQLAKETSDISFAEALLESRVKGQECISLATDVLQHEASVSAFGSDLVVDMQRCVLKTLLNIARTGDIEACRKICSLTKPQIIKIAENKSNPTEMRATAVQLMQCLVQHNKSVDQDFVSALRVRSHDKCRVSKYAQHALASLQLIST